MNFIKKNQLSKKFNSSENWLRLTWETHFEKIADEKILFKSDFGIFKAANIYRDQIIFHCCGITIGSICRQQSPSPDTQYVLKTTKLYRSNNSREFVKAF